MEKRYVLCPESNTEVNIFAWCNSCPQREKCWGTMALTEMIDYGHEWTKTPIPYPPKS